MASLPSFKDLGIVDMLVPEKEYRPEDARVPLVLQDSSDLLGHVIHVLYVLFVNSSYY